ncbi:MAG: DedA family protein [Burkholderiales bacterium]
MELLAWLWDVVVHLDKHLLELTQTYGVWVYAILFLVIFSETGFVVTPFLPGDSLLFVLGTLAAAGALDIGLLIMLLTFAAIAGNQVNYAIGRYLGPKVFKPGGARFLKPEYLERTHRFFEKHGGKTIIITRFVPIVRTYAPFVAGVGAMEPGRFTAYNVVGGVFWIVSLTLAGYFFGNFPIVKNNLTLVIFSIIFLSILPGIIEYLRHKAQA